MSETQLFKKVYGSVAASNIGSAIGAAVEWVSVPGGGWKAVEDHFGWVEGLLPWVQQDREVRYWNNSPPLRYQHMDMPPGMTEDGAEIRYLLELAMIEKNGRITVEDLADVFRREIKREDIGRLVNPHIVIHLDRLQAGDENTRIHPRLIGSLTPWPGLVDAAHMIGPVGIINAGDARQASLDTIDICSLLQPPVSGGTEGSRVIAAATAEAFRPEATVDSVIEAARNNVSLFTRQILDQALEIAVKHPDLRDIREPIRKHFMPTYPYADAVETAAEVLALFWITKGDVREGLIGATNIGRDTDCIGGMLGSICGAFKGIDGVPTEWVETVQSAINANEYTMQKLSMKETAVRLTTAVRANLAGLKRQVSEIEQLDS
ncbi:ADP-ribosylglycohydrolase family protein [Pelagibacterium halotolerans]|uniref:ADP-ribosylglycohydrolase n=1 Tax=Pelagibacterium halotolerans (strain DSM 22347 / JCM 15775 / CGMCC 1.7692 / B2) TaxID=1082931 RepID=G4RC56_PELHB|nr:ADP-ribosylglycohydrolase family protein [Pelagibacterium halotolerans]AEQ52679.1 ADP-ribosylglycohydrolase [Pelagibacterium halotolerans B2]QJR17618.1 ADP-ribosylglycohydrolase family protein [Pelagibacterium halotolerans]SEA84307.1 ADP-ribosylglycohydrolase [Pelagibacterium halotolerans]